MRTSSRHDKVIARIHRIAGQVAAIERSVLSEAPCADPLHIVSAVRGAVAALMDELVHEY
ncbi:metal-sensing transcriptional repressor [Sphingorhabdus sp.]|uniref:metal-sensing transcriptional repressor n=1 Tax=Sphingorhabdus sp. TaxID=1902408 RepID=UPI003983521F